MPSGLTDVIQLEDRYYILASSSRVDDRTRVLKHGQTFAVFDRQGDVAPVGVGELGLYHLGTRFLSQLALALGGERPLLLSSAVTRDNITFAVHLTNPDVRSARGIVPRGTLHVAREKLLWQGVCYERLEFSNYGLAPMHLAVTVTVDADFRDIFQVRGTRRERTGRHLPVESTSQGLVLAYHGLDDLRRRLCVESSPAPECVDGKTLRYALELEPHARTSVLLTLACETGDAHTAVLQHEQAKEGLSAEVRDVRAGDCSVWTSNDQFNDWIRRSQADLHMMVTETAHGPYPYAGVPWFSAPFGRDGIITALQTLWLNPELAQGVLSWLAAHQADTVDDARDAQPGRIMHEAREGEMARLGEVPFGRYYGSVDATPLFVVLAGEHFRRTGDLEFARRLWPNVERALNWMDEYGDADGDGFIEYQRRSRDGLIHQGWKDSHDAVFHADGSPAAGPIALCEVQGYAYAARREAARLAQRLGLLEKAERLERQADELRQRFEDAFWCEDLGTYALALDGAKEPCRVRTSNPGHCLFAGIASRRRARRVMETLLAPASLSGWGVRTVTAGEVRYNPISYHNGSVWPHDNSLAAAGFARYGFKDAALRLMGAQFEASLFMDQNRLPELFCGFDRRPDEGPTLYPVACAPQAWAAGAAFLMLQATLGLSIEGERRRVSFRRPRLPAGLREVRLRNLRIGNARLDVRLERHGPDVGLAVLRRSGRVEVRVIK